MTALADNPFAPVTVSAASYDASAIAPDSIVAAFGTLLATETAVATTIPLPTSLGGTSVRVNGQLAGLFFVSPLQVNYVIPSDTAAGTATVQITSGDGTISTGTVQVNEVAPSVFSGNADGQGVPAGYLVRIKADNTTTTEAVSQLNETTGKLVTRSIDLGSEGERVFLILFLSGISHANDPNNDSNFSESIQVVMGGTEVTPSFAGNQGFFVGLNQINVEIPRSLIGRGKISLAVAAAGYSSSKLNEIEIGSPAGDAPPAVSGFGSSNALAGQTLVINGSGFSTNMTDNTVRIGGTEANVTAASSSQLTVLVPYGAESGTVSVRTPTGEGSSSSAISLRTSISGFVEDTDRQPMSGISVRLSGSSTQVTTNSEGLFVLPDVSTGAALVEVDASTVTSPPFPKVTLKMIVSASRDNQFSRPISMQQATGPSLSVGSSGSGAPASISTGNRAGKHVKEDSITTDSVTLDVPAGTATFPDGSDGGTIYLTLLGNGRTPVDLPSGQYSTAIAQISPFGVTLNPGGKLSFPNPEGLAPGTQGTLFRLEQSPNSTDIGKFIESGTATVSADGQRIETADGAITKTGIYFVSRLRQTTTVIGRCFDSDGVTLVRRGLIRTRGQETFTDGNGGFILRNVPAKAGDLISVEASYQRPNGRIDRKQSAEVPVVVGGITVITPDIVLPAAAINRPPVIQAPFALTVKEGERVDIPVNVFDPDEGQTITVTLSGPGFASLLEGLSTLPSRAIRLAPGFDDSGAYTLTLTATDDKNATSTRTIPLTVVNTNRPPTSSGQSVTTDEDTPVVITLTGTDPDGNTVTFIPVDPPMHGSMSGAAPTLTYTPAPNYNGPDSFRFKASDGRLDSPIYTVSITVSPVNDPPVANGQLIATAEDTAKPFTLAATDVDGDTLTFAVVTQPQHGTLSGTAPNLTYTPAPDYNGPDSFTFKANDGKADSNVATVGIGVTPVNDPPVASSQSVTTDEDTAKVITLAASDVDNDPLTFIAVTPPQHGTLNGTGSNLTYTPALNYNGPDSFSFKVNDGQVDSNIATVSITVSPVNDPPFANGQLITTAEDTAKPFTLTVTDVDGDTLTFAVVTQPQHGSLSGTAPNLIYTPAPNYNGPDNFTFKVNDGKVDSNTATVGINVTPVNDLPVADPQSVTTPEDTARAITLVASDVDNDPLTFIVGPPQHGTLSGTAPNLTYTPAPNYNGPDSFSFKVNDGQVDSNIATVSITVSPVNDPPVANNQSITTAEDTAKPFTLGAGDVDGDALTFTIVSPPLHGSLSGTAPNLTYTPALNYNGSDSFSFKVNDGTADSNIATVGIGITPVNDPPVASGQTVSTAEDTAKAITLVASDIENDPLTWIIVSPPLHGSLSGTAPNLTYTPAPNYNGLDSFTFKVNDGQANSNIVSVDITITPVNDPPVANGQTVSTPEDTAKPITLGASDVDGDTLTWIIVNPPQHGSLSGTAPNLTFTPAPNYNGPDSFTFKVNDGAADSNLANVSINVTSVNDPPVANGQSISTAEDTPGPIALSASDIENDALTWIIVNPPQHGSLSGTAPNLTFTPAPNYNGPDSFTFKVNDGAADSSTATVNITVTPVNDPPVANPQNLSVNEDTPINFALTASDVDGDTLSFTVVTQPQHGSLSGTAPNLTYTPALNYNGPDNLTFKVNDGQVDSNTATITFNVNSINDPPVLTVPGDQNVFTQDTVDFTISGSDVDTGQTLSYVAMNMPPGANFDAANKRFTWTPDFYQVGTFIVDFKVLDNGAPPLSDVKQVRINVGAILNWSQTSGPEGGEIFALDSDGSGKIFAGTFEGIFKSADNGATWGTSNGNLPPGGPITSFARIGTTYFVGRPGLATGGGTPQVYRSTNGGATWTLVNNGLTDDRIRTLFVSGTTLFAATEGGGVFRTADNGNNWSSANNGLQSNRVFSLGVSGSNLYAGTDQGISVSTDNGDNWTSVNTGLPTAPLTIPAMAIYSTKIYAAVNESVYEMPAGGSSWTKADMGLPRAPLTTLSVIGSNLYAGTLNSGIYRTTLISVIYFNPVNAGLRNREVLSLLAVGTNLFAGTKGGVYVSADNGQNWTSSSAGIPLTRPRCFAQIDSTLFVGTYGSGMFKSTDNGATWTSIGDTLPSVYYTALAAFGSDLYAGTDGQGIFYSRDNGATWASVESSYTLGSTVTSFAMLNGLDGPEIYASTNNGIIKALTSDYMWVSINNGLSNLNVRALALVGARDLYAGTDGGGIFYSSDFGDTWTQVGSTTSGLTNENVTSLAVDGANIYAGTGGGVFVSTTNGATWAPINTGITNLNIQTVAASSGKLFAGTIGGVFFSKDGGTSWKNGSYKLKNPNVRSLFVSGANVFAGTDGSAVFVSNY
ncbi:MAG TPA: Ig-like domain-containing protein [Blastocatellia bacterium]|nr:Ig-like domain-containing protein [Blastocatellia bacterium]